MENISSDDVIYTYQIDYSLTDIPNDLAYFPCKLEKKNPLI